MATPAQKFEAFIDQLGTKFSARVGSWLGTAIGAGIDAFTRMVNKGLSKQLADLIHTIESMPDLPEELKPILEEMKTPTGEGAFAALGGVASRVANNAFGRMFDALMLPMAYGINVKYPNVILGVDEIIGVGRRRGWTKKEILEQLAKHGLNEQWGSFLMELGELRFPSDLLFDLRHRDYQKYYPFRADLDALAISPERQDALWELSYALPSVRDVVGFLAHEVFEPKMIAKYGLDDEWGELDKTMFEKVALKEDIALNYWRDHWQHASWSQVVEMLHRGIITEQDVYDWFRLVEIPPYWRKGLTATMYNLPGRIEIRMMAASGLIDKAKVMELLKKDGLAQEYLEVVADMNIVRGVRSDIQTRYIKGWLDSAGVKAEIDKLGLADPMPERLYQWIVSNTKPDRTQAQKDLTKAEIVKAVKLGELAWGDGVDLIMKMGYDEDEASIILAIGIPVAAEELSDVQKLQIDTTRRQRRKQTITKEAEVTRLIAIGVSAELATAYADNDEVRLGKVPEEET